MKKILSIVLIVFSIILIPMLLYISIKEKEMDEFIKTWIYVLIGYVSITSFYIGFFVLRKDK